MFSYEHVKDVSNLPKDLQEKVLKKKEEDKKFTEMDKYKLEKALLDMRHSFEGGLIYYLPYNILRFLDMEGSDPIVESDEFKEMTVIAVTELLSKTIHDPNHLKRIDLVMMNVLGTSIGGSEFYKNIFLNQTIKSNLRIYEMKKIIDIIKDVSIMKKEYVSALEKNIENREEKYGFNDEILEAQIAIGMKINRPMCLRKADELLESDGIYGNEIYRMGIRHSIAIYKILQNKLDFPIGQRTEILLAYKKSNCENYRLKTTCAAKRIGLIPYKNKWDRLTCFITY